MSGCVTKRVCRRCVGRKGEGRKGGKRKEQTHAGGQQAERRQVEGGEEGKAEGGKVNADQPTDGRRGNFAAEKQGPRGGKKKVGK